MRHTKILTLALLAHGVPLVCGASPLPHAIAADFARWRPTGGRSRF